MDRGYGDAGLAMNSRQVATEEPSLRELFLLFLLSTVALLHRFSGLAFRAIFQCGGTVQRQVLRVLEMEEIYLSMEVRARFIRARSKMSHSRHL